MGLNAAIFTFCFANTAWIMIYILSYFPEIMLDEYVILLAGTISLPSLAFLIFISVPKPRKGSYYHQDSCIRFIYCWSILSAWSCIIDIILFLEALDYIDGFMDYYLKLGEPYLAGPFGKSINIWDGTVHLYLYISIVHQIYNNGKYFTEYGLIWCGTMVTGMFTFVPTCFLGSWAESVHPAALLNIPYFFIPIWCLHYFMVNDRPKSDNSRSKNGKANSPSKSIINIALWVLILFSILYHFIRGFAALGSLYWMFHDYAHNIEPYLLNPDRFGSSYCILNLFYAVPFLIMTLIHCINGNIDMHYYKKLSLFYVGSTAQGTWYHLIPQLFIPEVPKEYVPDPLNRQLVISLNLILPLTAILLAYRLHSTKNKKFTTKKIQ